MCFCLHIYSNSCDTERCQFMLHIQTEGDDLNDQVKNENTEARVHKIILLQ